MAPFETKESAPIDKKAELKAKAAIVLSDDYELLESFKYALETATPEEIEENYDKLIKNPTNIRRIAINAHQFQTLEKLKQSMSKLDTTIREVGKKIEPLERVQEKEEEISF